MASAGRCQLKPFVNPEAAVLATTNAVLTGRSRDYHVHAHTGNLSLKMVLSGTATWTVGNRRRAVDSGTYLVVNHDQTYDIDIDAPAWTETFCVFFEPGFVESVWQGLSGHVQPRIGFHEVLAPKRPGLTAAVGELREVMARCDSDGWDVEDRFRGVAEALLCERMKMDESQDGAALDKRVFEAREFLLDSFGERLQLGDVAAIAGYAPQHFHYLYKRTFGETPHATLTSRRLERAAEMLRKRGTRVDHVCGAVGFQSQSSFTKLFRAKFGASPGKYGRS